MRTKTRLKILEDKLDPVPACEVFIVFPTEDRQKLISERCLERGYTPEQREGIVWVFVNTRVD